MLARLSHDCLSKVGFELCSLGKAPRTKKLQMDVGRAVAAGSKKDQQAVSELDCFARSWVW